MLVRHTFFYAIARIIPGFLNFLAITVYTRILTPADYGVYAVVITLIDLTIVVCFQWLKLSLLRFYQANSGNFKKFLSQISFAFFLIVILSVPVFFSIYVISNDQTVRNLILLTAPLLWARAWFELDLELLRSQMKPAQYGLIAGLKAAISLGFGTVLIFLGFGFYGPLLGLLFGCLIAIFGNGREKRSICTRPTSSLKELKPFFVYGMPLMVTFALAFVISSSDRLIIAWYLGETAAGVYSAGYDLVWQVITLLMVTVNLAAYPISVKVMEQAGKEAAEKQLVKNGTLLLIIGVPITFGFLALIPQIVFLLLGEPFRDGAAALIPWIAFAAFLAGIRSFHFDIAFQLSLKTIFQIWITGIAALVNIVLNFIFIPMFGAIGAAYATGGAYLIALLLSMYWGRELFSISLFNVDTIKIFLSGGLMMASLWLFRDNLGFGYFMLQVVFGSLVYGASIFAGNVHGIRSKAFLKIRTIF